MGTEISDRIKKKFPKIKGLFHSDELPKYGIEKEEVKKINQEIKAEKNDSFIFICQEEKITKKALEKVFNILEELTEKVQEEVRQVTSELTSKFLRVMPSSARMYLETDVPKINVENEIKNLELPELYETKINRLKNNWDLEKEKIDTILENFEEVEFENYRKISNLPSKKIYEIIFDIPKDIKKRDNKKIFFFEKNFYKKIFENFKKLNLSNSILRNLFSQMFNSQKTNIKDLQKYLQEKELISNLSKEEIENEIKQIIKQNQKAPFGALMGICMKKFSSKVEGKIINEILKKLYKH